MKILKPALAVAAAAVLTATMLFTPAAAQANRYDQESASAPVGANDLEDGKHSGMNVWIDEEPSRFSPFADENGRPVTPRE